MRKEKTLFIIGLWVMVLSFLGFTSNTKKVLFFITGFFIMYIAYLFYLEVKHRFSSNENNLKPFVDSAHIEK